MNFKKYLRIAIPVVFYALLIIFFVIYLRSIDFTTLMKASLNWWLIAASIALGLAFRYWGAYIWIVILRSLGAKEVKYSPGLIYVYAKSWLGRYIPGTAPWILGKIYFASKHGISKNKLAVSSLLEGGLQVVVLLALSFGLLIFDSRLNIISAELKLTMLAALVGCIVCLYPPVFNFFISFAYRVLKKKKLEKEHLSNSKTIFRGSFLYLIGAIINGVSLYLVAKAVYGDISLDQIVYVMGVGTLAGAMSMIAIFAPSGLGVREGIQLVLLSSIMPTEFALIVTILTRVTGILTDIIFFFLASYVQRISDKT